MICENHRYHIYSDSYGFCIVLRLENGVFCSLCFCPCEKLMLLSNVSLRVAIKVSIYARRVCDDSVTLRDW